MAAVKAEKAEDGKVELKAEKAEDGKVELKAEKAEDEKVELMVPRGGKNERDYIIIGINGYNYKIKRGVPVMVPPGVKEIYEHSIDMQNEAADYDEQATKQS